MKTNLKHLSFLFISSILLIIYSSLKYIKSDKLLNSVIQIKNKSKYFPLPTKIRPENKLKYILQWTSSKNTPFVYMDVGRSVFIKRNCTFTNCYVTADRNFFTNYKRFDVIIFAGPEIVYFWKSMLPESRLPHQKYVYVNIESAAYYPVCTNQFNNYFNWTWTYKLDSDLRWGYIVIRDSEKKIVGPSRDMHWIKHEDMLPVSDELKNKLRDKTKAAAWFVSNCESLSGREYLAAKLNKELKIKYNLTIDIYGKCGFKHCPRENGKYCEEIIRKDYFFYLAFENAFSEDYVTEKILHAVQNNAIPIVFGGANYSRFLPEGSYLDAKEMSVENLAAKMNELIKDFVQYVEYFRWTNHYFYQSKSDSVETDDYCQMCALLNDKSKVNEASVYGDFAKWWNPNKTLCYDNVVNYMF